MIDRRKFGRRKEDEKYSDLPKSALVVLVVIATLMVVNLISTL
jgi:hypothetical protein